MKVVRVAATLQGLRGGPLWKMLAAERAPAIVASLQALLTEQDKVLPGSVFVERLEGELNHLRDAGHDLPLPAKAYTAEWISQGWLTRRLPADAPEEVIELSADATQAIRFLGTLLKPRSNATESRLASVMQQISKLAEETESDRRSRLDTLEAEKARIEREIESVQRGHLRTLSSDRALERAREIIAQAEDLAADFRGVRDQFDKLNRSLRQSLMEQEDSRSQVLEALFAGVDLIAESEEGKSFNAFWRLLTDSEQSAMLGEALDAVTSRPFARLLEPQERRFLLNFTSVLMTEGGGVHEVLSQFARSLKSFVQSREFQEHRRLRSLIKQAQQAALEVKDTVRSNQPLDFPLSLTNARIRSASQWQLHDPGMDVVSTAMADAKTPELDLALVAELVRKSEIDTRTLKQHVKDGLVETPTISIGKLLERFPAEQGLGSVMGYVALGSRFGVLQPESLETVSWVGTDGVARQARIPTIHFHREKFLEQ